MSIQRPNTLLGECIAEFIGTGLLIFFGVGCVAALVLAGANFGQWEISITWGLGVAIAIYVTGGSVGGVQGHVVRTLSARDKLAPAVQDDLITHADAARQRGIAELSNTGRQAHLSLRLPVLQETGVIKPGALVRYVDAGTPRLGLVRGTQVEWSAPTLRQVLAVETHV